MNSKICRYFDLRRYLDFLIFCWPFPESIESLTYINSNVYCRQLMKLDKKIKEKRPELSTRKGVIFHQDNARPHTCLITRKKLLELDWEVMPHPPYSPDLAPSDYHLFRSLENNLNGKTFDSNEDVKNELIQFFASKNQTFYESGIMKLTERWHKVIEQNSQCIINKCPLFGLFLRLRRVKMDPSFINSDVPMLKFTLQWKISKGGTYFADNICIYMEVFNYCTNFVVLHFFGFTSCLL